MQIAGRMGWSAREDASRELLVALYLRDAIGVAESSGVPRMLGTGLAPTTIADAGVSESWREWWRAVAEHASWGRPIAELPGSRLVALPADAAPLADAIRPHLQDAETWADVAAEEYGRESARRHHLDAASGRSGAELLDRGTWGAVRERERELGRAARPFQLRIEVLPTASSGLWRLADELVAVAESTYWNPPAYRAALRPVIASLA